MEEQLGCAVPVEPDVPGGTSALDAERAAAGVSESAAASPTPGLTARYILVEDIDYLTRTGNSRQVLALRWIC
jgi:hypothetical protein